MKKMYINPKTLIVNVHAKNQLMAGSVGAPDAQGNRKVSVSDDSFSGSGMMSRKGGWDDED